jgi:hypothetical protein
MHGKLRGLDPVISGDDQFDGMGNAKLRLIPAIGNYLVTEHVSGIRLDPELWQ